MVQAVSFNAAGQQYSRTATGLGLVDFTIAFWVKLAVDRNAFSAFVGMDNGGALYNDIGTNSTGTQAGRFSDGGDSFLIGTQPDMVVGTWYYFVNQNIQGATFDHFFWGTATTLTDITIGVGTGTTDACTFYIGNNGFGDFMNGSIACVRAWTALLTQAELEAEMVKANAVRTANLWADYSFQNGPQTNDESGNARTLSGGTGAGTDASGPPVTAGSGGGGGAIPTFRGRPTRSTVRLR